MYTNIYINSQYRGPDPCVANMDSCLVNWQKSHFPFLCQYVTRYHPRIESWGAHLRPPHYGASLTNSFSQWSSVAPISCLFFFLGNGMSALRITTTTTTITIYFNKIVFPSVLGLTSPMAFPQHFPPPWPVPSIFPTLQSPFFLISSFHTSLHLFLGLPFTPSPSTFSVSILFMSQSPWDQQVWASGSN